MKKRSVLSFLVFGLLCATTEAQKSNVQPTVDTSKSTTVPAVELSGTRLSGVGSCRARFNGVGKVADAQLVQSSGSDALDQHMLSAAKKYWHGRPNTTVSVPIKYVNVPTLAKSGEVFEYDTPLPEYPLWAINHGMHGRGAVQVMFDAQGAPVGAWMLKSCGFKPLDDYTVKFVLGHWKSTGGEESMVTLPISYLLIQPEQQTASSDFVNEFKHHMH